MLLFIYEPPSNINESNSELVELLCNVHLWLATKRWVMSLKALCLPKIVRRPYEKIGLVKLYESSCKRQLSPQLLQWFLPIGAERGHWLIIGDTMRCVSIASATDTFQGTMRTYPLHAQVCDTLLLFLQSTKNSSVYTLFNFPGAWEHGSTLPNLVPLPQRNNFQPGGLCLRVVVSCFLFYSYFF